MMLEEEYYELAKKKSQKDLMDDYWSRIAARKVWISKDGTETSFHDLEFKHLINIINGLMSFDHPRVKDVIRGLVNELVVRARRKTPSYIIEFLEELIDAACASTEDAEKRAHYQGLGQEIYNFLTIYKM